MLASLNETADNEMANLDQAKAAAKAAKVKGFRKLKLKHPTFIVGRQCQYMTEKTVLNLMAQFETAGFRIDNKSTLVELAKKGLADCITIQQR